MSHHLFHSILSSSAGMWFIFITFSFYRMKNFLTCWSGANISFMANYQYSTLPFATLTCSRQTTSKINYNLICIYNCNYIFSENISIQSHCTSTSTMPHTTCTLHCTSTSMMLPNTRSRKMMPRISKMLPHTTMLLLLSLSSLSERQLCLGLKHVIVSICKEHDSLKKSQGQLLNHSSFPGDGFCADCCYK